MNLQANWTLLEQTGTSTNVLSKAAHDLAGLRTRERARRAAAAAVGYVATEVAKEVPYYAGAFGAAFAHRLRLLERRAASSSAARTSAPPATSTASPALTRAFLRPRRRSPRSRPTGSRGDYLTDYYSEVEPDEVATIAFFVDAMRDAEPHEPVLFFGVGPTLHHVFLAAGSGLGDPPRRLPAGEPGARSSAGSTATRTPTTGAPFVRYTLQCEGTARPTDEEVAAAKTCTRKKITRCVEVDARQPRPVDRALRDRGQRLLRRLGDR